jgi:AraC-like DNA-binding protein
MNHLYKIAWRVSFMLCLCLTLCARENPAELESRLQKLSGKARLPILMQLANLDWRFSAVRYRAIGQEILQLAEASSDHKKQISARCLLGYAYYLEEKYDKSLEQYFLARQLAIAAKSWIAVAKTDSEIGNLMYYCFGNYPEAIKYYRKSWELYRKAGDRFGQIKHLVNMGEVYRKTGDYREAVRLNLNALSLCDQSSEQIRRAQVVILLNLSHVNVQLGNMYLANQYLAQARSIAEKIGDEEMLSKVILMSGLLQEGNGHFEAAVRIYLAALKELDLTEKSQSSLAFARHKGNLLIAIGRLYSRLGQIPSAIQQLQQAVQLTRYVNDSSGLATALLDLARAEMAAGRSNEALRLLLQDEAHCQKYNLPFELKDVYDDLLQWYQQQQNFQKVSLYQQRLEEIKKRIKEPRLAADVMAILTKYESNKLTARINTLLRKGWIMGGCALLLVLLLVVAIRLYIRRMKERSQFLIRLKDSQLDRHQTQLQLLKARLQDLENSANTGKYHTSSLSPQGKRYLLKRLIELMETDKPYLDSDLTLRSLAERLHINEHYLSQVINENTGESFYFFINTFRLEEAKRLLREDENQEKSMLDICYAAGFNSKSSFYRAFKKCTGLLPCEFRR